MLSLLCAAGGATASEEASSPLDDHPEWLACNTSAECTSVTLGCYYWQPVNKNYAAAASSAGSSCLKSVPAGPQPTASCVDHECVNAPFTVRYWTKLESYQKFQQVMRRVEACHQASGSAARTEELAEWTWQYEAVLDGQIRSNVFMDDQPLSAAIQSVVPCAELIEWEQGQEKWQAIQAKNSPNLRVTVAKVQPAYKLDSLYPPLLAFAEQYRQCGQSYVMPGFTFTGDMQARFMLDAEGRIDPASLNATYPGVAYMRPFLSCAETAFKNLSFPLPPSQKPIAIEALIQALSKEQ